MSVNFPDGHTRARDAQHREVVALANFHGGRVLIGVEDDGQISGIQRPDLERWVMDTVFG